MGWTVEYYRDSRGKEPGADFIDSLPTETQAKVLRTVELLARYGVLLKEPYSRRIKGKLRELRVVDRHGHIRVLYFTYTQGRFVILHGFLKKSGKTPRREIEIGEKRMSDFIQRCGGGQ
ncbi:MAG: type II toxin-antitoxin system RelE/ParE family toxin [Syntrophorhabdaceae bacterium]|nr:type II toxin-antitoxin system RelE/ParE family toxin [Syntrophorhabdaceae bacterium]